MDGVRSITSHDLASHRNGEADAHLNHSFQSAAGAPRYTEHIAENDAGPVAPNPSNSNANPTSPPPPSDTDSHVHAFVDALNYGASDDEKKNLAQIGDDATKLLNWFNSTDRGSGETPPPDVQACWDRLCGNDAIQNQLVASSGDDKGKVTRDTVQAFVSSLDSSADNAKKSWEAFQATGPGQEPNVRRIAADGAILQAFLPVLDTASGGAKADGTIDRQDLEAVANDPGNANLPDVLQHAAGLYAPLFDQFDKAGGNAATHDLDGLADDNNIGSFLTDQLEKTTPATLGSLLSGAAYHQMTQNVDISQLGPDVFQHPENYSGAQKAAVIQSLQQLNAKVQAGVDAGYSLWETPTHLNNDWNQVKGDIAGKLAQLSNDDDVKQFYKDNYATSLQSIVNQDPGLRDSLQYTYDHDVQNGSLLTAALGDKDANGDPLTPEAGLSNFMQTASTLNVALGSDGKPLPQLDFQKIAAASGQQPALQQAYTDDILSGKELQDALDAGTDLTTAISQFQGDIANFGAVLPGQFIADNADKLAQTLSDTVTDSVLNSATGDDINRAFVGADGNVGEGKLTEAVQQAIQQDPDLGKTSDGDVLKPNQIVGLTANVINMVRQGTKLQDALQKVFDQQGLSNGPGKPTGSIAEAYKRGYLHAVAAVLVGGVMAAREAGSSGSGATIDATRLGASMQITGALMEAGSKYLKDTKSTILPARSLPIIENAGKLVGGVGGAITGVLGIISGVDALRSGGDKGTAGLSIATSVPALIGGVASAIEGGLALAGPEALDLLGEGAAALGAAAAGSVAGAIGTAAGGVAMVGASAFAFYTIITAANDFDTFRGQVNASADQWGVTGGTEPSTNPPDDNFDDTNVGA